MFKLRSLNHYSLAFKGLGDGGNVVVILENNKRAYKFPILFENCLFEDGHAVRGGGIYISLVQTYSEHAVTSTSLMSSNQTAMNAITFSNNDFVHNAASFAGAAVCIMQKESYTSDRVLQINFHNCTFSNNFIHKIGDDQGAGGIAIHVLQFIALKYLKYSKPQYNTVLCNCSIHGNFVKHNNLSITSCSAGNGVIAIIRGSRFTIVNTTLTCNNCTAILAVGSTLLLEGELTISQNRGYSGGGLMFCDETVMFLMPYTHIYITNNSVEHAGGGICVDSQCLQTKPMCFFQFTREVYKDNSLLETIKIEVVSNRAPQYAGHNIFGGSIDKCFILDSPTNNSAFVKGITAFHKLFHVDLNVNDKSSITSVPTKVCFCSDNIRYDCNKQYFTSEAYPGQPFNVPVVIVGQQNGTVPGSVRTNKSEVMIKERLQKVPNTNCTNLTYTLESNKSEEVISIHVDHDGDISAYLQSRLLPYRYINVSLLDCPVGFGKECQKGDKTSACMWKCNCRKNVSVKLKCKIKDQTIQITSGGWIGYMPDPYSNDTDEEYFAAHPICPFDYCLKGGTTVTVTVKSTNNSIEQDKECQFNRTGILCGSCPEGFSVILGTSDCWKCSRRSLALIPLFAVMGVVLIAFLTVTNFTVSEGTISGLIFYANVVQIGATNFFSPTETVLTIVLKIFISWMNLDFGISACLYDGMDAYGKAWLQFVFPVYLWILSGGIVFLCNRYILVTRVFGKNSVKVLSTVILLSFTKLLRSVVTTMSFVAIDVYLPNTTVTRQLWLNDANVLFLREKHIVLFIAGLFFALLCSIFFLYLFCIQCLQRFRFVHRIKPFTDCYTGPNTSAGRFWTGLLLFSRVALLVAETIDSSHQANAYASCVIAVSAALLFIGHLLPAGLYSEKKHNILESFFLLNLIVLCIRSGNTPDYDRIKWSGIASFLVFIGLLVYHCSQRVNSSRYWTTLKNILATPNTVVSQKEEETVDSNVPTYRRFDQDREPLLASSVSLSSYQ